MSARKVDLHISVLPIHANHISLDAIAVLEFFSRDLLGWQQNAVLGINLGTQFNDNDATSIRSRVSLHDARNYSPFGLGIRLKGTAGFSLTQLVHDCVSDCWGTDSRKVNRGVVIFRLDFTSSIKLLNDHRCRAGIGVDIDTSTICWASFTFSCRPRTVSFAGARQVFFHPAMFPVSTE